MNTKTLPLLALASSVISVFSQDLKCDVQYDNEVNWAKLQVDEITDTDLIRLGKLAIDEVMHLDWNYTEYSSTAGACVHTDESQRHYIELELTIFPEDQFDPSDYDDSEGIEEFTDIELVIRLYSNGEILVSE